jgi:hypothetical protein
MTVDAGAHKVSMDVVAGFNPNNSNWNFNGYYDGEITVVVPYSIAGFPSFSLSIPVVGSQCRQTSASGLGRVKTPV